MTESYIEKFSKLKHRGLIPQVLFDEISQYADRSAIFLVKNGVLQGWDSMNLPHVSEREQIRKVQLRIAEEPDLFSSLIAARITQFKVHKNWKKHKLFKDDIGELFCLALPLKYGSKLFGALLCFKQNEFTRDEIAIIKEVALCASEFSVILPPQSPRDGTDNQTVAASDNLSSDDETLPGDVTGEHMLSPVEPSEESGEVLRAQLLARLLVNNIKLYNEEQVILGRMKRDLKIRLKKEIEEAEKFYNARVSEEIRDKGDFFENELVLNLAGGNISALK